MRFPIGPQCVAISGGFCVVRGPFPSPRFLLVYCALDDIEAC